MSGTARQAILDRIRRANGGGAGDAGRARAVAERLRDAPRGIVPARGRLDREGRIALFAEMAEKAHATTERIAAYADLPAALAAYLRERNFPATLRMGHDSRFAEADFGRTALAVTTGPSAGDDLNGLSHADAAIAETGTLMLTSGVDNPTSLNFLPENHVVAVAADEIVGAMETLWPRLRERYGKGGMPRTVNFVTGPSRSGDIEQILLLGAHGPRTLHVVIIG